MKHLQVLALLSNLKTQKILKWVI